MKFLGIKGWSKIIKYSIMKSKIEGIYKFLEDAGEASIPASELIKKLDSIQLRQLGQRHHERYSQISDELASFKDIKSMSDFLCNYLYSIIEQNNSLVVISFCNNENSEFSTESISGCPALIGKVQQLIEAGQLSLTLKNSLEDLSPMYEDRLTKIESLYYFVLKSIPQEVCTQLEDNLNLHYFYGYPVSDGRKIIATISFAVSESFSEVKFTEIDRVIRFARHYFILLYNFQRSNQLNQQMSSVFDAADFAFGIFGSDGNLLKANTSFSALFEPFGIFNIADTKFIQELGVDSIDKIRQGAEVQIDVSKKHAKLLPLLQEYSRGRITPVKATDTTISYFIFFLHSRKAELRILETMKISEQKYQRIFNHIQNVYFEIKLDGTILEISPSVQQYAQIDVASLIGTNILQLYADPERRADYLKEISSKGRVHNYELDLRMPDGRNFNTIITASIVDYGTDNERIVGSMVDVTQLKKKTKAILDNEIKFRSLFDSAPIGFMICDTDGEILEMNPAFLNIFCLNVIDKSKETNVLKNETAQKLGVSAIVKSVIETGIPVFSESQFQCPDGVERSFKLKISIIPDQTGGSKYVLIIAEDITDIKAKDLELELSRERFLDIYNNTSDLIYTMDFEGNFTSVNPVAEKWLGYKFQNLKNRNMREYVSHDSVQRAQEQIKLKLAHASSHSTYEVTAYTRNKEKMILEINSFLRYKDGNPIEVFGIARDITERKKHEEFITLTLRERERLIMEVHHRIKNNLQLVLSMLKMYSYTFSDAKTLQTFSDVIQKIMAISAAHEDFYFSTDFKEIDFKKYLETVVVNSIEQFDQNNRVKYKIESDNLKATIDEVVPLGLIVSELLSNSIRHGVSKDGSVDLFIGLHGSGQKHELVVRDNGPGISAPILNNIGDSLGLSLVAMLAENQLGGKYQINSDAKGTTVKVEF